MIQVYDGDGVPHAFEHRFINAQSLMLASGSGIYQIRLIWRRNATRADFISDVAWLESSVYKAVTIVVPRVDDDTRSFTGELRNVQIINSIIQEVVIIMRLD